MKKKNSNLQLQEKEVVSKRGVSSKTFQKKRGKFETKYYHKPIHQFDEISGCFIESAADKQNSKMTKLPGIIVKTEDAIQGEKLNVGKKGVRFDMNLPPRREGVITKKVNLLFHCEQAESPVDGSTLKLNRVSANGKESTLGMQKMQNGETEYSFDVTSEYDVEEGTTYSLSLINENAVELAGDNPEAAAVMTLSNTAVYSVEESDGKSEDDQSQGESGNIGSVGTYEVDVATGLLNVEMKGFTWEGNRMPISFLYTFESLNRTKEYGIFKGWKTSLTQTMMLANNGEDEYIYTDENLQTTVFKSKKSPCGTYYENENGDLYNASTRTLDVGDERYCFNSNGMLVSAMDQYKNTMSIDYQGTRISALIDGIGRRFNFTYDDEQNVMKIKAPNGSELVYKHNNGYITSITYPNGQVAAFQYTNNLITKITISGSGIITQTTTFGYVGNKVVNISNGSNKSTSFEYFGSEQTIVTDTETSLGDEIPEIKHYRVFFHNDSSKNYSYYNYEDENKSLVGNESFTLPVSDAGMEIGNLKAQNLLNAHVFKNKGLDLDLGEVGENNQTYWNTNLQSIDYGWLAFDSIENTPGCLSAQITSDRKDNQGVGIWQDVTLEEVDHTTPYVFSAYLRISRRYGGEGKRVYLKVTNLHNQTTFVSQELIESSSEFVRVVLPFVQETAFTRYRVGIYLDGNTRVCAVAPQLERGNYISPYNYISQKNSNTQITAQTQKVLAEVCVNRKQSVKEIFTVSANISGATNGALKSSLLARIKYTQTSDERHNNYQVTDDFELPICGNGFLSMQISKTKYRGIESIEFSIPNSNQNFVVSNLQLIRNSYQSNLSEEDFAAFEEIEDANEEDGEITAEAAVAKAVNKETTEEDIETIEAFEEAVDAFGNVLTGTNFKHGELGTIYTANGYSSDGNHKTSEIDARGNETKYEYDAATSKPTKVIDRCGNATQYEYDIAGRTTKVTAPNGGVVSYGYNSYDDLTQITRGDGQGYTMAYDAYRNLTQVKVGQQALASYTYNSGTNRLKSMEYANGSVQTLTYDRLGRLIVEKWTKGTIVEAHYRYFYDVSNRLEKTIDIFNKRMYNIRTDGENVTAIEEYEFASINETTYVVSGLTLIGTMHYSFDGEGKQFRKKYVATDGTEQKYVFEFQDEQNIAVQLPTGVVSHSKSDHLGRKVFDELQLGKGLMNRTFTYHKGEVTQAHLDNYKVVSSPETELVKAIEFADGRTIEYEYDAEERITKVIDSVDGTIVYTYDSLGQLVTEKKNGKTINEMVYAPEDDPKRQYGNILEKNGVVYTYDTTWKDKLIKVGTKSITYDAQGNPTSYLGHTLTWEKGRQLKSYDTNTYKYNKDGIRISKTVNGVEHKYVLDETNIVKETWGSNTLIPLYDLDGIVCGINYNGTAYYFYKNLQGDVIAITNDAGVTVAKYTYDAWGVPTIVSDSSGANIAAINPFRYRSYYYDTEIGMYYLQSRYYDANVGRFINSDLVLDDRRITGFNLFVYCFNDIPNTEDATGYYTGSLTLDPSTISILGGALAGLMTSIASSIASIKTAIATSWFIPVCVAAVAVAIAGVIYAVNKTKSLSNNSAKTRTAVEARVSSGGINPKNLRNYTVYVIVRKYTIDVVYVGITKNYTARKSAHTRKRFSTSKYTMFPIATLLTKREARALEQTIITAYGIGTLVNMINSISPRKWGTFTTEFEQMLMLIESWIDPE